MLTLLCVLWEVTSSSPFERHMSQIKKLKENCWDERKMMQRVLQLPYHRHKLGYSSERFDYRITKDRSSSRGFLEIFVLCQNHSEIRWYRKHHADADCIWSAASMMINPSFQTLIWPACIDLVLSFKHSFCIYIAWNDQVSEMGTSSFVPLFGWKKIHQKITNNCGYNGKIYSEKKKPKALFLFLWFLWALKEKILIDSAVNDVLLWSTSDFVRN